MVWLWNRFLLFLKEMLESSLTRLQLLEQSSRAMLWLWEIASSLNKVVWLNGFIWWDDCVYFIGRGNITDNFYDPAFAGKRLNSLLLFGYFLMFITENFVNSIADVMALSVELPRTNSTSSSASSVHGQYGPPVLTFRLRTNEEREAYRAERQACALRGQGGNQCRLT